MENLPPPNAIENFIAKFNGKKSIYVFGAIAVAIIFYTFFLSAPYDFPSGAIVKIKEGASLHSVSLELEQAHIIRSRVIFEALVIMFNGERHVVSTNYYFNNRLPVYVVARRISKGEHNLAPVSVTIPEGFDNGQIANAFSTHLASFDKDQFLTIAKNLQGYLFPDTYFFLTTDTEKEVINSMSQNFNKKIASLLPDITSSGKKESDIIIMASIIEREAKGGDDRAIISGILWKRVSIGMALQVDAAMETYKTVGLPKAPICNPGLDAIIAAIHPQSSPYLYYLHDKEGNTHYSKTFAGHLLNEQKYLK